MRAAFIFVVALHGAIVLVPLAASMLELRSTSGRSTYDREAERGLARTRPAPPIVTEADLAPLPPSCRRTSGARASSASLA